jgi:hypothetical protein
MNFRTVMIYDQLTVENLKLHRPSLINDPTFAVASMRVGQIAQDLNESLKVGNIFSTYQSQNSESLFLDNANEMATNRNLYDVLDQYYKISKI